MEIVYRAGDVTEAEIVRAMLQSHGIDAHVSGYYLQGGVGDLQATDLAKVHVENEDFEKARELVMEYEGKNSEDTESSSKTYESESSITQKVLITITIVIVVSVLSYWVGF